MSFPRATVRLQLHRDFTFADAAATVDYYASLGISHFYLSPVFAAREGSTHGYDQTEPTRINPELGGMEGLLHLVTQLRAAGLGLVIDIVPNHMGIASSSNRYWQDVLTWGRQSRYAHWFDIDWETPEPHLHGKVLLPILGQAYESVLRSGDLALGLDAPAGKLYLACYDGRVPLSAASCASMMAGQGSLARLATAFAVPPGSSLEEAHAQLAQLAATPEGQDALAELLNRHSASSPGGLEALHALLEQQHYRLNWWRNAAEEINWRRFFEVSDLAGVRVELEDVFEATHALVFELYQRGLIDGVRVDHVDGLADPAAYCRRLRSRLSGLQALRPAPLDADPAWIVVEKILSPGETLPADWGVDGTTGYDFMDQAGAVLHDGEGERALRRLWSETTGDTRNFDAHVEAARQQLLAENFVGEAEALARALHRYAQSLPPVGRDIALAAVRRVLAALLAGFRRYRSYNTGDGSSAGDRQLLAEAAEKARGLLRPPDHALLDELSAWLGGSEAPSETSPSGDLRRRALTRFQQLTPPLAAKAVEDTTFYRYAPLLSRNEVGSSPSRPVDGVQAFHAANLERATSFPRSLLATATHDHKRGEDVRARLAVLSEMPKVWEGLLRHWLSAHAPLRASLVLPGSGIAQVSPSAADEIMLYQTLVGAWPPGLRADDSEGVNTFATRVAAWQQKALREAKLHSSWMAPQVLYEEACQTFLERLLHSHPRLPFLDQLVQLVEEITPATTANSLTQTLLRLTSPGIPDLYQGCELADFSLVDPDNRQPVDMQARRTALSSSWPVGVPCSDGWPHAPWQAKQVLILTALQLRARQPDLFCGGDYIALEVPGPAGDHVVAFARRAGSALAITVALRHPARLFGGGRHATEAWNDAFLALPRDFPASWRELLCGAELQTGERGLRLGHVLQAATVALLVPVPDVHG